MKHGIIVKLFVCLGVFSLCLFSYLEKQNELTELRLYAPKLAKEIKSLNEENTRLRYEIEQFESPDNLMRLSRDTRFSHLRHPLSKDIAFVQQGETLNSHDSVSPSNLYFKPKLTLAVGAK